MSWKKDITWYFPYRSLPSSTLFQKTLHGLGGVVRGLGATLDDLGAFIQGPSGKLNEALTPNLSWAPVKADPNRPPSCGEKLPVPSLRRLLPLKEMVMPTKQDSVFIAKSANVLGDVKLGANASVWYGAVLRGDVNSISVGDNTNIQDNCTVHVAKYSIDGKKRDTVIGKNVTIAGNAIVHACTIEDDCLIGMGATVLDGVTVGTGSIVAAGAVVPPGTVIPAGQVWAGNPAKFLREVDAEEREFILTTAANYVELAQAHMFENAKSFEELYVEKEIEEDRETLADPLHSHHQMWVYDKQTYVITRPAR